MLVDLRHRTVFAAGHVPGTPNVGVGGSFATSLGWLIPPGTPLTLLGEGPEQVAQAQRELVRIGIDRPAAHATAGPADWADGEPASYPRATFADLEQVRHHRDVTVPDVRRADEWSAEHIEGAVHVPLHELPDQVHQAPPGQLWAHCAVGHRTSIAASLLAAAGRDMVLIDDSLGHAAPAGLPTASAEPVSSALGFVPNAEYHSHAR